MSEPVRTPRRAAGALVGLSALAALTAAAPARATDLIVTVANMRSADGDVHVSVYDDPRAFPKGSGMLKEIVVKATAPTTVVTFPGLRPGTYALAAFHDENGNREFDKNFLGMPLEDYAFSNDAPVFLSAPGFDAAAFAVAGDVVRVTMPMKR